MTGSHVDISHATTAARRAARTLAGSSGSAKDAALRAVATALEERTEEVLRANAEDVARARAEGTPPAAIDRLTLDEHRLRGLAQSVRDVAALPDPVGRVLDGHHCDDGLSVRRVAVPLGVVALVTRGRPDVLVDAVAVCLKAGNALLVHGGTAGEGSTAVLLGVARDALAASDLPVDAVQGLDPLGPGAVDALAHARGLVDLLIPRGPRALVRSLVEGASVPVVATAAGNCHVFVDADADLDLAEEIVLDSKLRRPGTGNAVETLLVHADVAEDFLTRVLTRLVTAGVTIHADEATARIAGRTATLDHTQIVPASEEDWGREYLSMDLAVRIVADLDAAIGHIRRWSSGHTEAICTTSLLSARRFGSEVDAAVVVVNAPTRAADGAKWGMGAQVGMSASRTHARGPLGIEQLTTWTWVVEGDGRRIG